MVDKYKIIFLIKPSGLFSEHFGFSSSNLVDFLEHFGFSSLKL